MCSILLQAAGERMPVLRSLESAAAAALTPFRGSDEDPARASLGVDDSLAAPSRSRHPMPTSLPRFESQPLRQNSTPPEPDPEPSKPPEGTSRSLEGIHQVHGGGEKRLSRFATANAGLANMGEYDTGVDSQDSQGGNSGTEAGAPTASRTTGEDVLLATA